MASKRYISRDERRMGRIHFLLLFLMGGLFSPVPMTMGAENAMSSELPFVSGAGTVKSAGLGELIAEEEAEDGILSGVNVASSIPGFSGTGYVTGFDNASDKVTVMVDIPSAGLYRVVVWYNAPSGTKTQDLLINNATLTPVVFPDTDTFTYVVAGSYLFNTGENSLTIKSNWGYNVIDRFQVYTTERNVYSIDPSPVDPDATEESVALYDFLKLQFGKRIISGQTTAFFDDLKELAGATPMINNGDLQCYTEGYPYAWDGGHTFGAVDDGRVDQMINWYNSTGGKGIVAFQWHWHSPSGGSAGTNTFYTSETTFDIREAVIPGNPEYTDIIRDIDAIAVQLKKFQDANIPVLWRPLHEAGGGWFWWGAHGPEPCLALYDIMYDRLMNHHQLHHLIWVWSTPETDWYPGNEKIDIVGHDSYPGAFNYSPQKYAFDVLFNLSDGKKLIAMTENGPIPTPADAFQADAPWLWFMSWSDLVFSQNSTEHLQDVFSDHTVLTLESNNAVTGSEWRSALYPEGWYPGYQDSEGRFLHDFSYAGYHRGEDEIPVITGNVTDITQPPYNADPTGAADVTMVIQQALDDVGAAGGGVVYLPAGTYRIRQSSNTINADAALHMRYDGTVLRGAGPGSTFIYHDESFLRSKDIIHVRKSWANWFDAYGTISYLRSDLPGPSRVIPVQSVAGFSKSDRVVVSARATPAFVEEHGMAGIWTESAVKGVAFLRVIDSIDVERNLIIVDSPVLYPLKTRDYARVTHAKEHISECGVENLSIGNLESTKSGWEEESYTTEGTGAWDAHNSHALQFKYATDCWVKNVHTYRPAANLQDVHVLSNTLLMNMCSQITVDSCNFQKPQYEGGGGNGYMYTMSSNNCLIKNSIANHSRHNYDFKYPFSNGNVILNCRGEHSKYASDFHMYLSMANLIDGFTVNEDYLESGFRPYGGDAIHGYSSTQSVFYNTTGEAYHPNRNYIIESRQWGWGYVIGTEGAADRVMVDPVTGTSNGYSFNTSPRDYTEGIGDGEHLRPVSLYLDQLSRRENNPTPALRKFNVTVEVRDAETLAQLQGCTITINDSVQITDYEGRVSYSELPELSFFSMEKEYYIPFSNLPVIINSDTTLVFFLSKDEVQVTLVLLDEISHEPFWGVNVTFNGMPFVSDSNGEIRITLPAGSYPFSIDKVSYQQVTGVLTITGDTTIHFYLTRTHAFMKFRLRKDGSPVDQAYVTIGNDSLATSNLGIALFSQMPVENSYHYTVRKEGFYSLAGEVYLVTDTTINLQVETDTTSGNGIFDKELYMHFRPNPVGDILYGTLPAHEPGRIIRIYDIEGSLREVRRAEEVEIAIDMSGYHTGLYILQLISGPDVSRQLIIKN